MRKNIYWRNIAYGLTLKDCQHAFYNRAWQGTLYDTIMIAHGDHKLEYGKTNFMLEKFTFDEATDSNWSIFVPDYEEEKNLQEIRELIKTANCLYGVTFEKIDNMSIGDIWQLICSQLIESKDVQMKTIKAFLQYVYETKNGKKPKFIKATHVRIKTTWDPKDEIVCPIDDIACICGSRRSNEFCEVTFADGSRFAEQYGKTLDAVNVEFS